MDNDIISILDIDDGHLPGHHENDTKLVMNLEKAKTNFFTVFDDLIEEVWSSRAYDYALIKGKPWGYLIISSFPSRKYHDNLLNTHNT